MLQFRKLNGGMFTEDEWRAMTGGAPLPLGMELIPSTTQPSILNPITSQNQDFISTKPNVNQQNPWSDWTQDQWDQFQEYLKNLGYFGGSQPSIYGGTINLSQLPYINSYQQLLGRIMGQGTSLYQNLQPQLSLGNLRTWGRLGSNTKLSNLSNPNSGKSLI